MLTTEQKAIISATVPILEVGGESLTSHFYQVLFRDFPQVLPLFNQANQADGKQQRALADAVLAYARNIDASGPNCSRRSIFLAYASNIDRLEQLGPLAS